ncbi:phosphoethanolamine transferase [Marinobacterium nitratireducens]|uniref:Phosphoethanolamine transferase n=1 Tax=Marinobacterium nitratireducens TaxID=518897 RepID=A0A917ZFP6_9GAMM|nr:phosphoethanolamine--lipid A transferase [Marinobacterium nitratireducens]GGO81244.1 phosphoethanolamine transferase [Marinobacterium nitratireducens]
MTLALSAGWQRLRPTLSTSQFRLLIVSLLVLFYNGPLWQLVSSQPSNGPLSHLLFVGAFFTLMVALYLLFLTLVGFRIILKPLAILLFFSAAMVSWFMDAYGIVIDKTMVQNLFETDVAEAGELFSLPLLWHLTLYGLLPSLLVLALRVRRRGPGREFQAALASVLMCMVVVGLNAAVLFKDYSSLFRNNRQIRNLAVPSNYLYYGSRYLAGAYDASSKPLQRLGEDAHIVDAGAAAKHPRLLVVVVGETARADNFSLNGYGRDTNPRLSQEAVIYFDQASSCGTSTAESLPCMFSLNGRHDYSREEESHRENVLDVLQHAGVDVLWRDNNSGCKGVCDRVDQQPASLFDSAQFCGEDECYDETLLTALDDYLQSGSGDKVVVLHQKGSHGPAYYLRYPQSFQRFTPVCDSNQLQACSEQAIRNAYDNTILYTDHFLGQVIGFLKARQDRFDSAMLYMSDHGESLGEGNIYLHGMPYVLAPSEQTHIPFVVWLSSGLAGSDGIDTECLGAEREQSLSHDNLAHSVLGLMNVRTTVYDASLDIFRGCRQGGSALAGEEQHQAQGPA